MTRLPLTMKIEIPFVKRCPRGLCRSNDDWDTSRMEEYVKAVEKEVIANADQFDDCSIEAIRLGGGCASLAPAPCVADLMRTVRQLYHVAENAPVSMTASIADISGATMPFFRRAKITRFDFMMMSLDTFDFARLNTRDNLRDFPLICECFGSVPIVGVAIPLARTGRRPARESGTLPRSRLILHHRHHAAFL